MIAFPLACVSGSLSAAAVTATPAADSTGGITITVTGLASGESARIERILDLNANGTADGGDPLVQSFLVADGQVASFDGVRNPNIPGDEDSVANEITTRISLPTSPETGRMTGSYLIRVSSPTSAFSTISTSLAVTPDHVDSLCVVVSESSPNASRILPDRFQPQLVG